MSLWNNTVNTVKNVNKTLGDIFPQSETKSDVSNDKHTVHHSSKDESRTAMVKDLIEKANYIMHSNFPTRSDIDSLVNSINSLPDIPSKERDKLSQIIEKLIKFSKEKAIKQDSVKIKISLSNKNFLSKNEKEDLRAELKSISEKSYEDFSKIDQKSTKLEDKIDNSLDSVLDKIENGEEISEEEKKQMTKDIDNYAQMWPKITNAYEKLTEEEEQLDSYISSTQETLSNSQISKKEKQTLKNEINNCELRKSEIGKERGEITRHFDKRNEISEKIDKVADKAVQKGLPNTAKHTKLWQSEVRNKLKMPDKLKEKKKLRRSDTKEINDKYHEIITKMDFLVKNKFSNSDKKKFLEASKILKQSGMRYVGEGKQAARPRVVPTQKIVKIKEAKIGI